MKSNESHPSHFSREIPFIYEDKYPLFWQMTRWEKHMFVSIVEKLQPEVAIEIGNAQGGSLQVLSKNCQKVYALDFSKEVHEKLQGKFDNVAFHTGDSKLILPDLLKQIQDRGERLGFVLIDGDHATSGVRADINSFLHHYIPVVDCHIIFHDSFNPVCRRGIIEADWQQCPYVHGVDIDFLPGTIMEEGVITRENRSIWGGFSMAILRPEKRVGTLEVKQSLLPTYKAMYKSSRYNTLRYWIGSLFYNRYK